VLRKQKIKNNREAKTEQENNTAADETNGKLHKTDRYNQLTRHNQLWSSFARVQRFLLL